MKKPKGETATRYRTLADGLFTKDTATLYSLWQSFKHARTANDHLQMYDDRYMTVMEREALIDILFERLMNEQKERHRKGDDTTDK